MTDRKETQDDGLALYFEAAKSQPPSISPALQRAILADADEQASPRSVGGRRQLAAPLDMVRHYWGQMFGGWRAAAAFAVCAGIGIWVGYAPPNSLMTITDVLFDSSDVIDTYDIFTDLDTLLLES